MVENGLTVNQGTDMTRIQVTCKHQSGLIYVVPAERSWVCDPEKVPAHALAGFFRELVALNDPGVRDLMGQWGIYYRQLPLEAEQESSAA
ncbi:MAG: hypothetical protein BZY88_19905 [SAR202 cluster bacterium Io17-Chloro-G9]|nr:MAG: hypothetical protein BZY88_19905 [SAR202 cluster bacterium Io17-Chloro-G9]